MLCSAALAVAKQESVDGEETHAIHLKGGFGAERALTVPVFAVGMMRATFTPEGDGPHPKLALLLYAPGQGRKAVRRDDGSHKLIVTFQISQRDLGTGNLWKIAIVNYGSASVDVKGQLHVSYPQAPPGPLPGTRATRHMRVKRILGAGDVELRDFRVSAPGQVRVSWYPSARTGDLEMRVRQSGDKRILATRKGKGNLEFTFLVTPEMLASSEEFVIELENTSTNPIRLLGKIKADKPVPR